MPRWIPQLMARYYPEGHRDATQIFYPWVRAHLTPDTVLLNLGAGPATGSPERNLRGQVARVVGADVDPLVLDNDELDEAHQVDGRTLPFADDSFDTILADYVFEHVGDPLGFLTEARRVLRPWGSLFFRTPNRFHYTALIARATPHRFHERIANRARRLPPTAPAPFPTLYRLNGRRRIERVARQAGFREIDLRRVEGHPAYLAFHAVPFLAGVAYERLVNRFDALAPLRANIIGRMWGRASV